jgi:hypothetical protein
MTDDIVTRLREQATDPHKTLLDAFALEAADEIAKLRYQIYNHRNALCAIEYVVSEERRKLEEAADEWWEVVEDEQPNL